MSPGRLVFLAHHPYLSGRLCRYGTRMHTASCRCTGPVQGTARSVQVIETRRTKKDLCRETTQEDRHKKVHVQTTKYNADAGGACSMGWWDFPTSHRPASMHAREKPKQTSPTTRQRRWRDASVVARRKSTCQQRAHANSTATRALDGPSRPRGYVSGLPRQSGGVLAACLNKALQRRLHTTVPTPH